MRKQSYRHSNQPTRKLVVLGAGESGVGAAQLGLQNGWDVFVSDYGVIKDEFQDDLRRMNLPFEQKQHTEDRILAADVVVKSPGIPEKAPIIKKIRAADIPIISEIEWGYQFVDHGQIIAITGSNGKTTTTSLIGHMMNTAGLDAAVGGNIGTSFAKIIANGMSTAKRKAGAPDYYVLEISSFQLDEITDFKPEIAILLNITPDHLDRYEYNVEYYAKAKLKITENQTAADHFIYNNQDEITQRLLNKKTVKASRIEVFGDSLESNMVTIGDFSFTENDLTIKGPHNLFNATCAVQVMKLLGINNELILKGLATFQNVPHRLENVRKCNGIEYINDSKATNVDAVYNALKAMTKPVIWVVGGTDKGNEYESMFEVVEEKVKAIVCLGVDNTKILEAFSTMIKIIEETSSAQEAVLVATKYADPGDVVLLSPACASFDRFKNYEDRGDQFKEAVMNLKNIEE